MSPLGTLQATALATGVERCLGFVVFVQDNVPPFETQTALRILEDNLGAPPSDVFADFEEEPVAAASLGQVHLATLKTGERVVVKVQRPGLKDLFDIDLKNIRYEAVNSGYISHWLQ